MNKIFTKVKYYILIKLLKKKYFYSCDFAGLGEDYSVFCLWEIDKDGIIKLKKIEHTKPSFLQR